MQRLRVTAILLLLVAASATVAYSFQHAALETFYYTDITYTTQVGYRYIDCEYNIDQQGTQTTYFIQYEYDCDSSATLCNRWYYDEVAHRWERQSCDWQG